MNIKLTLSYDGTRYRGFQRQSATPLTIQQKIEDALSKILQCPTAVTGSGRTDAGVHAKAYTANFHTNSEISPKEIMRRLNELLPEDIAVTSAKYVSERFHSRYNILKKAYTYRINTSAYSNVFERKYVYNYFLPLNIQKMEEAAELLTGTHDFLPFSSVKKTKKSTIRKIFSITIIQKSCELDITYVANGFLYNMARILTGTLLEIGSGERPVSHIRQAFETGDRSFAGFIAPAKGLIMEYTEY